MKHSIGIALALVMIAALTAFALAEGIDVELEYGATEPETEYAWTEDSIAPQAEPTVEELGEVMLDAVLGEAPAAAPETVATYRFIVGDTLYAVETVKAGEALPRPEDPTAPEGAVFAGWALEDGALLFTDADGDGAPDPVIIPADMPALEVNVLAVFAESAEQSEAEQTAVEAPASALPTANALTYTGEPQALVTGDGPWLYSTDGENYAADVPTAVNAGEYAVYYRDAEAPESEPQLLTATIAKAEVTFTPPMAMTAEG